MIRRFEDRVVGKMTDHERSVLRHSALWFFLVLFGYYILRPIREQISTEYGIRNLAWLFRATFVAMLVAIPLYSVLVSKFHRRTLVPCIYAFFFVGLLGFWSAMTFAPEPSGVATQVETSQSREELVTGDQSDTSDSSEVAIDEGIQSVVAEQDSVSTREWTARVLFIWISVYGLFIVSFFWSVVGDMLNPDQGRRLFGFVAGGGTAGGLVASMVVSFLVEPLGQANLLLITASVLVAGLFVYWSLERSNQRYQATQKVKKSGRATGGNPFAGFTAVFGSRYLFAICLYGFLLATCGTTIYFQQSEIVAVAFDSEEAKTKFFSRINFCVQVVTLILQTAVVGRLMNRFGLGLTLALLPMAYILGIGSLAIAPTIFVLAIISVTGRSAEYAIANPAREVLFTAVRREDRYKAKSFIDTIVRRGGDSIVGSAYKMLRENMGMAMTTLSWCVVPIAVCWVGLGFFIGQENKKVVQQNLDASESERIENRV